MMTEKLQLAACHTSHYQVISMQSRIKFKLSVFFLTSRRFLAHDFEVFIVTRDHPNAVSLSFAYFSRLLDKRNLPVDLEDFT